MSRKPKLPELDLRDRLLLTKLVRFAVLDANHVAEHYGLSPGARSRRFELLRKQGFVVARGWLEPLRVYVPTSLAVVALGLGHKPEPMYEQIAAHHLAIVDLADVLLSEDPLAGWRTERELRIDRLREEPYSYGRRNVHRPD